MVSPYEFSALTVIDTTTNLVELVRIDEKNSDEVARKYAQCWLARYPWPQQCVHDPGRKFTGIEFQTLLEKCHITDACTSAKNLQSNAICERMHQTIGNVLRTLLHGEPPKSTAKAKYYIDEALSIAMHACNESRSTFNHGKQPRKPSFNRDIFLNIPLIADWHATTLKREHLINENLMRENQKRRRYDYAPQQKILQTTWKPRKLGLRTTGPYTILRTHVNGAVTIELRPGISERLNIRRIILYGVMISADLKMRLKKCGNNLAHRYLNARREKSGIRILLEMMYTTLNCQSFPNDVTYPSRRGQSEIFLRTFFSPNQKGGLGCY